MNDVNSRRYARSTCWGVLGIMVLLLLLSGCAPDAVRRNNAGNRAYLAGAYQDAVDAYGQAQVAAPDRAEPYYNAANALNQQGKLDATVAETSQALKTADSNLAAWAWYNLGNAFFDAQDWPEAVAAYQEALRLHPDDLDAKHNLELARRNLVTEQEQSQQSAPNDQQSSQPSPSAGQGAPREPASTPVVQPQEPDTQGQSGTPGPPEMTAEQARQLLRALIGNAQNLQQRLQEPLRVPQPPPEKDW